MDPYQKRIVNKKIKTLEHAQNNGNVSRTCRYFGISRQTFYEWKRAYEEKGEDALVNKKPGFPVGSSPRQTAQPIVEKIIYLRKNYHFGAVRISWYLKRYHGIKISSGGVYYTLKRNGLNILPKNQRKRSIPSFQRYEKQIPGHHVQVDVKFLFFYDENSKRIKRFQYTAIDDSTRVRALKIYKRHTQENAVDFINYIISLFPFRIHTIRTDNGHEFQAKFHWHLKDLGINHVYIKPATPRLNGKVERSHRTDKEEFYQLLEYKGDMDLEEKLKEWEMFYNLHRPHYSLSGKTPFEVLRSKLKSKEICHPWS